MQTKLQKRMAQSPTLSTSLDIQTLWISDTKCVELVKSRGSKEYRYGNFTAFRDGKPVRELIAQPLDVIFKAAK